ATYDRQLGASIVTVPTAAIKAGDLSGSSTPIFDPNTGAADGSGRTQFLGNQIPAGRLDSIAVKLASQTPLPNLPGTTNNYYATGAYQANRPKIDGKLNWIANTKLNVSARVGWQNYSMQDPPVFGTTGGSPVASAGGRAGHAYGNVYSTTYSATYAATPSLVLDSYFGWTNSQSNHDPVLLNQSIGQTLGLAGTNGSNPLYGGWPDFAI